MAAFLNNEDHCVRLHSALGYRTPEEFEQAATTAATSPGATMSFCRQVEILPSDGKRYERYSFRFCKRFSPFAETFREPYFPSVRLIFVNTGQLLKEICRTAVRGPIVRVADNPAKWME